MTLPSPRRRCPRPGLLAVVLTCAALVVSSCGKRSVSRWEESGERFFATDDYRSAEIEFMNVLRFDPENALAPARLGTIWMKRGSAMKAARFLLRARDLDPDNPDVRVRLAEALFALGMVGDARHELLAVLNRYPDHGRALLMLAESSLTREALSETREVLGGAGVSKTGEKRVAEAVVALREADPGTGKHLLGEALELNPASVEGLLLTAELAMIGGDAEEAERYLLAAVARGGPFGDTRIRYLDFLTDDGRADEETELLEKWLSETPDDLKLLRRAARRAVAGGDVAGAEIALERIFELDPLDLEGGLIQVRQWASSGETRDALARLEALRDGYPPLPGIEMALARLHVAMGNRGEALAALDRVLELDADFEDALLLRVDLLLAGGETEGSAAALRERIGRNEGDTDARLLLAEVHRAEGRPAEAYAILRDQMARTPADHRPRYLTGLFRRSEGRDAEARVAFETASKLAPGAVEIVAQLASLDVAAGRADVALGRVDDFLERFPDSPGGHFLQAVLRERAGDADGAEAPALRALELRDDFLPAYELLAGIHLSRGDPEVAAGRLEDAVTRSPDDVSLLMRLASIEHGLGRSDRAGELYGRILELDPDFAPALNNLANIRAGEEGMSGTARGLAEKARRLSPDDPAIAATLGVLVLKDGDYRRAHGLLSEAAVDLGGRAEVFHHLAVAARLMGRSREAELCFSRALLASEGKPELRELRRRIGLLDGKRETGPEALSRELEHSPGNPLLHLRLGEELEKAGRYAEARETYAGLLREDPELVPARLRLAGLYAGVLADSDRALAEAELARSQAPEDAEVLAMLGKIALRMGRAKWAHALLSESVARAGDRVESLADLAWSAYALGRVDEARGYMTRVRELGSDGDLADAAGRFLALTGAPSNDPVELSAALVEGFDAGIDDAPALMARGSFLESRGNPEAAVLAYRRILADQPGFVPARKRLAQLLMEDPGGLGEAEEVIVGLKKDGAEDSEVEGMFACLLFRKGEVTRSVGLLSGIASRRELNGWEALHLGLALAEQGKEDGARDYLRIAIGSDLEDRLVRKAGMELEKLEGK